MNSHSFVEIPKIVIENYVKKMSVNSLSTNTAIALTTYGNYDLNTTLDPKIIPEFFPGRKFKTFEVKKLFDSSSKNLFFVSPGTFPFSYDKGNNNSSIILMISLSSKKLC